MEDRATLHAFMHQPVLPSLGVGLNAMPGVQYSLLGKLSELDAAEDHTTQRMAKLKYFLHGPLALYL